MKERSKVPPELPDSLPSADRDAWGRLTAAQREKALARNAAFWAWRHDGMNAATAVEASGLSSSRFYRLAADWQHVPSLATLGIRVYAAGGGREPLNAEAVNALQGVVPDVVRLNSDAKVSRLVRLMVAAADVPAGDLPGASRLREIVETEIRRRASTHHAGHRLCLDCCAINLPREGGRPHVMFACVDMGTRLILGCSVGRETDVERGYAAAALNVRERLVDGLQALPWAARLMHVHMVAGTDMARSVALLDRIDVPAVAPDVQLASAARRFGRYVREVAGQRLGRVELTPARTETGGAAADNGALTPWPLADAAREVAMAIDEHNAGVLANLPQITDKRRPEGLDILLDLLSAS